MRIFVTGSSGYLGSQLVKKLIHLNYDVYVIHRNNGHLDENIKRKLSTFYYDGTITSLHDAMKLAKPDIIIHMASMVITNPSLKDTDGFVDSNVKLMNQILIAMVEFKISNIVIASTIWQQYPINNIYTFYKQYQEDLLDYFSRNYNINGISIRLPDTYGPKDNRDKIINLMLNSTDPQSPLDLSPGKQEMDILHVNDVIQGFLMLLHIFKSKFRGFEVFSLSSKRPLQLEKIVEIIKTESPHNLYINLGKKDYRHNEIMKIKIPENILPNWDPKVLFEDGIRLLFRNNLN